MDISTTTLPTRSLPPHLQQPETYTMLVFALCPSIHTSANQIAHHSSNLLKETQNTHTQCQHQNLQTSPSSEGVLRSTAHMTCLPPVSQAEGNGIHSPSDGGPPSAGCGRRSGPSAPAWKRRVHLHQPTYKMHLIII
jgi:hypothetical protein